MVFVVESWILIGLFASLMFGSSAIAMKMATSPKFFGLQPALVGIGASIGLALVFFAYFFLFTDAKIQNNPIGLGLSVLIGILWALGNLGLFIALKNGADIARMTPLYNTNTLIAVVLGIFLLHELPNPTQSIKVVVGAVLIVVGAVLVSI